MQRVNIPKDGNCLFRSIAVELTTIDSILIAINSSSLYACVTKTICVCVRSREITFGYTCLSGSRHGIPSLAHRERYMVAAVGYYPKTEGNRDGELTSYTARAVRLHAR